MSGSPRPSTSSSHSLISSLIWYFSDAICKPAEALVPVIFALPPMNRLNRVLLPISSRLRCANTRRRRLGVASTIGCSFSLL